MAQVDVKALCKALGPLRTLAVTLYGECRGEGIEGQVAVGSVIKNRVRAIPANTYESVCTADNQFSCWWPFGGYSNYQATISAAYSLMTNSEGAGTIAIAPQEAVMRQCLYVATGIISGALLDPTHGATNYYAPAAMVPPGRVPDWAAKMTHTATIGKQEFYR